MDNLFRQRKTHFPRTYFILKQGHAFYLLFWLEYGNDNSLYVWFDDNQNNSWEVLAKHSQFDLRGSHRVHFKHESYAIFDPHISWHQSGIVHVRGYDCQGYKKKRVISNKLSDNFEDLKSGMTTPFTQIIMPTTNAKKALKYLGEGMELFHKHESFLMIIDKNGLATTNVGASEEAFIIIDENIIPKKFELGIDISIHHKNNNPNPNLTSGFMRSMIHPEQISLFKGSSNVGACVRVFSVENKSSDNKEILHAVATCFNKETIDIFQLKKL